MNCVSPDIRIAYKDDESVARRLQKFYEREFVNSGFEDYFFGTEDNGGSSDNENEEEDDDDDVNMLIPKTSPPTPGTKEFIYNKIDKSNLSDSIINIKKEKSISEIESRRLRLFKIKNNLLEK